jgi:hypothetical protein
MIARIWQGCTRPGMGKAYIPYLAQTGLKEYQESKGFKDIFVLTREIEDKTEYLLITLWEDMEPCAVLRARNRTEPFTIPRTIAISPKVSARRRCGTTRCMGPTDALTEEPLGRHTVSSHSATLRSTTPLRFDGGASTISSPRRLFS